MGLQVCSGVEKLFCYQPKRRKVNQLCIGDLVYVQEHLKDLICRDAEPKTIITQEILTHPVWL